ncbi:MAG: formate C-acetyltransferase/glycerol dehydratase family glycyl radical enzyme [Deltaproteobacteria bacterium]|nr:formate C-acetyltransferase/glycerol dehydratase family glycyl radical enzyme [Deltaproteobacteria bacterium]
MVIGSVIADSILDNIRNFEISNRIKSLKKKTFDQPRYLSIEQAKLITESYQKNEGQPVVIKRAKALALALEKITITIDPEELIIGNRTAGIRGGVVSPEAGIGWVDEEIETLPTRPQDKFNVKQADIKEFKEQIAPYWQGKSLEDEIKKTLGAEISEINKVVKINQTDHAQGHICPNVEKWLQKGPAGILKEAQEKLVNATGEKKEFYQATIIVLNAYRVFLDRYEQLAADLSNKSESPEIKEQLLALKNICFNISHSPPRSFRESLQSLWFLFVLLQLESNASSFSPGRIDQYLYPILSRDLESGELTLVQALELIEALWIKFNHIVYLRNSNSAKYFAGFPIGFNVVLGGQTLDGKDASNMLSFLCLKAQDHIGLPQPNVSARFCRHTSDQFIDECSRVIGLGSGMPQIFNDESIIPALENQGIQHKHAMDYAVVGCVELTTPGNNLGWSDAAMFNIPKALELTINNGKCLLSGKQLGLQTGYLTDYSNYEAFENAFEKQIHYFIKKMIDLCDIVDRFHARILPSPFLSTVVDGCLENGIDVTAGGALYNLSGIQMIQVANIADSLAVIKKLVYDDQTISKAMMLDMLNQNYQGYEEYRQKIINHVPKYGNDIQWVDQLGLKWTQFFVDQLKGYTNARGGVYHVGLYTVSAHVPMGKNVGASPDGRLAETPLADGGVSPSYGRDQKGPTAVLKSVSKIDSKLGSNGTLLNLKFLPDFFKRPTDLKKFSSLLKAFVMLKINHVQFNVVKAEDLKNAQENPEAYRGLTIRVAGYTAFFTELARDLQDEIILRTCHGEER